MLLPNIVQGTPEWHRVRQEGIGASEVAALFNEHKTTYGRSEWVLYKIKSGQMKEPDLSSDRARMGLYMEPAILTYCALAEGWSVLPGGYAIDDTDPQVRASLDGIISEPSASVLANIPGAQGPGVAEVKIVERDQIGKDWIWNPQTPERPTPPFRHMIQCQAQLAATGFQWGALAAGFSFNNSQVYYFKRQERLIAQIRQKVAAFYFRIACGDEPEIDGGDVATAAIKAEYGFHRPDPNSHLRLHNDPDFDEICAQRDSFYAQRKHADEQCALYDNRLRQRLGKYESAQGREWAATAKPDRNGRRLYRVMRRSFQTMETRP